MNAVDRLKRDHKILRAKLDVLESALQMGSETWFVLREVCYTLSRQLQDHIKREEELVKACRDALTDQALTHVTVEHKDEPQLLRSINRLFVDQQGHSLAAIKPALTELIQGLRAHMVEEEADLFPVLERVLAARETGMPPRAERGAAHFNEVMAVNRVLREYPATKRILESLFVNIPFEGCDCLDEVAWRRGMEVQDLLRRLEEAVVSCSCGKDEPKQPAESARQPEPIVVGSH